MVERIDVWINNNHWSHYWIYTGTNCAFSSHNRMIACACICPTESQQFIQHRTSCSMFIGNEIISPPVSKLEPLFECHCLLSLPLQNLREKHVASAPLKTRKCSIVDGKLETTAVAEATVMRTAPDTTNHIPYQIFHILENVVINSNSIFLQCSVDCCWLAIFVCKAMLLIIESSTVLFVCTRISE